MSQDASRIGKLILVPALITLAVTLLRLVGELQGWSPALFNRGDKAWSPALVGIVWLVPVFGAWFGWKLTRAGSGPGSLGRAFGLTLAALAVIPLAAFLAPKAGIVPEHLWRPNVPVTESLTILSVFVVVFFVGIAIGILAWPALGRTLLAYGLAARIPIALLMLVAMLGNWGTHYDARPSYPSIEHARVVGHARAGAATLVLDLVHDRVRCAVRNRRSGDRAAAGNGSRLEPAGRAERSNLLICDSIELRLVSECRGAAPSRHLCSRDRPAASTAPASRADCPQRNATATLSLNDHRWPESSPARVAGRRARRAAEKASAT